MGGTVTGYELTSDTDRLSAAAPPFFFCENRPPLWALGTYNNFCRKPRDPDDYGTIVWFYGVSLHSCWVLLQMYLRERMAVSIANSTLQMRSRVIARWGLSVKAGGYLMRRHLTGGSKSPKMECEILGRISEVLRPRPYVVWEPQAPSGRTFSPA